MYHVFRALCKSTIKALWASWRINAAQTCDVLHERIQLDGNISQNTHADNDPKVQTLEHICQIDGSL